MAGHIVNALQNTVCTDQDAEAHAFIANYLNVHSSRLEEFKTDFSVPKDASDWVLLDRALASQGNLQSRKLLEYFAYRKRSYGLRYGYHRELGKSFVTELLKRQRNFFSMG